MLLKRTSELLRFGARRLTAWARLRPTYLVIGAQKSGTTSLHDYLAEHPAVLSSAAKEVQYFHRYYKKGELWYRSRFPLALHAARVRRKVGMRPAIGEASPDYLFDPRAPARVHAFDPGMKLIAVLRDPVERAYSQWRMEQRRGNETRSFEEALDREEAELEDELTRLRQTNGYLDAPFRMSYVARGRYAEQLERWLAFFPREQLLVLVSDELRADPAEAMDRAWSFLGLPEWRSERYRLRGVQGEETMASETRERLARTFAPHNKRLEALLGRELHWTRAAPTTESPSTRIR
jgi:hypothetical protein